MGLRVLYLTQTFPPEPGSTLRPLEQAQALQAAGHDVTVITAFASYPTGRLATGDRWRGWRHEEVGGVPVLRVATITAPARGQALRLASYMSFAATSAIASGLVRRPDVVIASVPHLFTDLGGLGGSILRRARLVLELRDLLPESALHAGVDPSSLRYRGLLRMSRKVRLAASALVVPYDSLRELLIARDGWRPSQVLVVPHGASAHRIETADRAAGRRLLGAGESQPVALYGGSFAPYYGVRDLVTAAQATDGQGILWALVGTGQERESVQRMIRPGGPVRLLPPRDPAAMGDLIAAADVVLAPCATPDAMPYVPFPVTKIAEALAMGRPVIARERRLAAGPWLEQHGAGIGVPWTSPELLGKQVAALFDAPDQLRSLTRGAAALGASFRRERTMEPLLRWLESAA